MNDNIVLPYAYVDGSYNQNTNIYGYGVYMKVNDDDIILQGCGDDPDMATMRNIAGEICGATAAVIKAIELKIPELTIYYDFRGIEMWATGLWKRNKAGTMEYYNFMQESIKDIKLHFVHIKGHSGVYGNELADKLAKESVGVE